MQREDEPGRGRASDEEAFEPEVAEHKHPAAPQQPDTGFEEGMEEREGDTLEEQREPDFARGQEEGVEELHEDQGRFSEGQEDLPDTPEKEVERRFSEGVEDSPTSE